METLDLLAKPEVVIRCEHYRGFYALNEKMARLEKAIANIKPTIPVVLTGLLLLEIAFVSVPYLYSRAPDLIIVAFAAGFILLGLILALSTIPRANTIKLSAAGITIQGPAAAGLPREQFKWPEFKHLVFAENGQPSETPNQLFFSFGLDGCAEIELSNLSRTDLQEILLAIALWGPHAEIKPAATAANLGIKDRKIINPLDFTELWQSNLEKRFSPTVFVPLERDQSLQEGAIKVLGQVACGGMSAIYLANHANLGTVVLKESVISGPPQAPAVAKARELFKREAMLLCGLSHARIAKIYDYFVEDDRHYLVLEHIPGRTLRNFVSDNGPVGEIIVQKWAIQLADVLVYLHGQKPPIIHRDLTPDNIIVGEDGQLSVIDFGAANVFLGTATGTIIGKASYMPPEQFRGKASTTSDIFALGGVMYYLLNGQDPMSEISRSEAIENKTGASPRTTVNSRVPSKLAPLIYECLQADAKDRPASALILRDRLKQLKTGKG